MVDPCVHTLAQVVQQEHLRKARSLQRKPLGERWNPGSIELVMFFPCKVPGDPNADEDFPEVVRLNRGGTAGRGFQDVPKKLPYQKGRLDKARIHCKVSQDAWLLFKENESKGIRESAGKGLKTK